MCLPHTSVRIGYPWHDVCYRGECGHRTKSVMESERMKCDIWTIPLVCMGRLKTHASFTGGLGESFLFNKSGVCPGFYDEFFLIISLMVASCSSRLSINVIFILLR